MSPRKLYQNFVFKIILKLGAHGLNNQALSLHQIKTLAPKNEGLSLSKSDFLLGNHGNLFPFRGCFGLLQL